MKSLSLFLIGLMMTSIAVGQKSNTLLSIGEKKVSDEEFKYIYSKNNTNDLGVKSPEEYLDLFINFKLFVVEAESLKLDESEQFKNEFQGYKEQLAEPYLAEAIIKKQLLDEAYDRSKYDVKIDLIYIKVDKRANVKQQMKAEDKAKKIKERLDSGEDFEKVATETSDTKSVARTRGHLLFIPLSRLPYEIQNEVVNAKKGVFLQPISTQSGYYILRLVDKRKSPGLVHVAHIMVSSPKTQNEMKNQPAKDKAEDLYNQLLSGASFEELAKQSDDKGTGKKGGELPWFGTGRMVAEFEDVAFNLKNVGDMSKPIKTEFGWHIIKLLGKKPLPTKEEATPKIQKQISRDVVLRETVRDYVNSTLKKRFNYSEVKGAKVLYEFADSSFYKAAWEKPEDEDLSAVVFKLNGEKYTADQFADFTANSQRKQYPVSLQNYIDEKYNDFVYEMLQEVERKQLYSSNDQFRNTVREYHDGMLLFDYKKEYIWDKASIDSVGLKKFYKNNIDKFQNRLSLEMSIFEYSEESQVEKFMDIDKKDWTKMSDEDVVKKLSRRDSEFKLIQTGRFRAKENIVADKVFEVFEQNPGFKKRKSLHLPADNMLVHISKMEKVAPKKFEELRGLVISEYQHELEQKKLEELKEKYKVRVNKKVLKQLEKELK